MSSLQGHNADEDAVVTAAGSKPAPKKDRIHGSKVNKPGSAETGTKVKFSARTEDLLRKKLEDHNKKASPGRKATMAQLKAVYRRGAGAYSSSHRAGVGRDQWAIARVNAYLHLLKSGKPANSNYVQDNDLLPATHPRSTKNEAQVLIASGVLPEEHALEIEILPEEEYASSEDALLAMAEISGAGYEIIPALRAAWLRGVHAKESPFDRAMLLASALYASEDADLLPLVNDDTREGFYL